MKIQEISNLIQYDACVAEHSFSEKCIRENTSEKLHGNFTSFASIASSWFDNPIDSFAKSKVVTFIKGYLGHENEALSVVAVISQMSPEGTVENQTFSRFFDFAISRSKPEMIMTIK